MPLVFQRSVVTNQPEQDPCSLEDVAAFRAAVSGEYWPAALEILYGYKDLVAGMIATKFGPRVGGPDGAEDLFSNCVTKLISDLKAGTDLQLPSRSVRAWIYAVVHNRTIDWIRREERPLGSDQSETRARVTSAHNLAEVKDQWLCVLKLIKSSKCGLSEKQGKILTNDLRKSFDFEDKGRALSDDELSAHLNICKQRVWNLRHAARARIAPHLERLLSHD